MLRSPGAKLDLSRPMNGKAGKLFESLVDPLDNGVGSSLIARRKIQIEPQEIGIGPVRHYDFHSDDDLSCNARASRKKS